MAKKKPRPSFGVPPSEPARGKAPAGGWVYRSPEGAALPPADKAKKPATKAARAAPAASAVRTPAAPAASAIQTPVASTAATRASRQPGGVVSGVLAWVLFPVTLAATAAGRLVGGRRR